MGIAMINPTLITRLPAVRGRYEAGYLLSRIAWFKVGGPADVLFSPTDTADLANFMAHVPGDICVSVIGVASNLLVRDGGVAGVVVKLGREFNHIHVDGSDIVVGAGALDPVVARAAAEAGIAGLEFLIGIPGTIGGALRMNAGAYGREMKDVVVEAEAIDPQGRVHRLTRTDLGFTYRHSAVPDGWIFTSARLRGTPGIAAEVTARMDEIRRKREDSQPVRTRTGGSTFTNPGGPNGTPRAWELVDRAGCRGLVLGGARVSPMHTNFLENTGDATAADIEELGEIVRRRVLETSGVTLEWEIQRIGRQAGEGA
jgi:UDP-N-acetylmuramate dehydrogenase